MPVDSEEDNKDSTNDDNKEPDGMRRTLGYWKSVQRKIMPMLSMAKSSDLQKKVESNAVQQEALTERRFVLDSLYPK